MDDIDIGTAVMDTLGLPADKTSSTEEKVGEERLGSESPLSSFGATLLLSSIVFGIILLIVIIVICIVKRNSTSQKCKACALKLKRAIFFNPIIRYLLLNALKLNMSALMVIKATDPSSSDLAIGIATLTIINGAPLVFYVVINR